MIIPLTKKQAAKMKGLRDRVAGFNKIGKRGAIFAQMFPVGKDGNPDPHFTVGVLDPDLAVIINDVLKVQVAREKERAGE